MNTSDKPEHLIIGELGEAVAADYLQSKGYVIIKRNYRYLKYELDIIAKTEGYIVFAEVKTRNYFPNSQYGRPARAVDNEKRKNLLRAAKAFVKYFGIKGYRLRFDVIEVYVSTDTVTKEHSFKVNHMKGVFGEGGRLV
jgi:putative endonuclease